MRCNNIVFHARRNVHRRISFLAGGVYESGAHTKNFRPEPGMDDKDVESASAWLVARGLAGDSELALLHGFCERCLDAGLELSRGMALIDTLHPVHEGRVFHWRPRRGELPPPSSNTVRATRAETAGGLAARAPSIHLLQSGNSELRRQPRDWRDGRLSASSTSCSRKGRPTTSPSSIASTRDGAIGEMDCFYSRWTTDAPRAASRTPSSPRCAGSSRCWRWPSNARLAGAHRRNRWSRPISAAMPASASCSGRITRGVAERINAVLWFSDLRGYTLDLRARRRRTRSSRCSTTMQKRSISADPRRRRRCAEADGRRHTGDLHGRRSGGSHAIAALRAEAESARAARRPRTPAGRPKSWPVTSIYLGLHIGDVFYGNIGSEDRLDFTVVGPAVNEVSRIASMCRSADRDVLFSSAFLASLPETERAKLVSVGRYALRGVGRAQELFTLDPELSGRSGDDATGNAISLP